MSDEQLWRKVECEHKGSTDPTDTKAFCDPSCEAYVGGEGWYLVLAELDIEAATEAAKLGRYVHELTDKELVEGIITAAYESTP